MILTTCAACAKPLEHDAPAHCVNCQTRYCSDRCLRYHAHRGGHDDKCEEIARGGGAEQCHAEKKYEEAVADAVEACADDTEGQTCYICLEDGSEEGLVRGCACRGASGIAHVSCLARQAKILVEEAEESDLDDTQLDYPFERWDICRLCEQEYHGVVSRALGWACWKIYVGRPEDHILCDAIDRLGNGLADGGHLEDALSVQEAELAMLRRVGVSEERMLTAQSNLAVIYSELGLHEKALPLKRDVYSETLKLLGEENRETLVAANNYAATLLDVHRYAEAKSLLLKTMSVVRRVLGENSDILLKMKHKYAQTLYEDPEATLADLCEAVTTLEDVERTARRVLGGAHPLMYTIELCLRNARAALRARETPSSPESS